MYLINYHTTEKIATEMEGKYNMVSLKCGGAPHFALKFQMQFHCLI